MSPTRTHAARRPRGAFTLIELLVVVAVIAGLVAVLLPALTAAREQGKVAVCLANNRSLMQATILYLADWNDRFPYIAKRGSNVISIDPFIFGGRTNDEWWIGHEGGINHHEVQNRPLNVYLLGTEPPFDVRDDSGRIIRHTEVPVLRCPSDMSNRCRQSKGGGDHVLNMPAYHDIGTSYLFNTLSITRPLQTFGTDVRRQDIPPFMLYDWLLYRDGWMTIMRDLVRHMQSRHASSYTLYWEEPVWLAGYNRQLAPGNHKKFSRHTVAFLDGHSRNLFFDTRGFCDVGWQMIVPEWVPTYVGNQPQMPWSLYYYHNGVARNCNPQGQWYPSTTPRRRGGALSSRPRFGSCAAGRQGAA